MSVDMLEGQAETNAEAWFNIALRPRKPEGSLGRTAQDGHLHSHTAPELCNAAGPAHKFGGPAHKFGGPAHKF